MPIDPSIPLGIKTFQPPDILETVNKIQGLRNAQQLNQQRGQEMQLQQQQIDQNALDAKDKETSRQEDATLQEIWGRHAGDPNGILQEAAGKVRAKTYIGIQKSFDDERKTRAEIADKELAASKDRNEHLGVLTGQVLAMPDDKYAADWPTIKETALQIDPSLQLPDQPIPKEKLNIQRLRFMTHEALDNEELQKRAAAEEARKAALAPVQLSEAEAKAKTATDIAAGKKPIQPEEQVKIDQEAKKFASDQLHFEKTLAETKRHNLSTEANAGADRELGKILSPIEAATLQVPYGTTRAEAAARGITPSTQAQNVVATYASRMKQSGEVLDSLAGGLNIYERNAPNFMNTAEGQQVDQAQRDFINALLRRESGAAISTSEFDNAYKQYIPRTGDSKEVIQQKKNNRDIALGTFKRAAGNAYQDPAALIQQNSKAYTQADVDAAIAAHPGLTADAAEKAFKDKGYTKR